MSESEDASKPEPLFNDKHWLFKDWNSADDNVEVSVTSNGGIYIEVDNPWAGDSESGFGERGTITLPPDVARALAEWLMARTRG